jgi:hypothetical protein
VSWQSLLERLEADEFSPSDRDMWEQAGARSSTIQDKIGSAQGMIGVETEDRRRRLGEPAAMARLTETGMEGVKAGTTTRILEGIA